MNLFLVGLNHKTAPIEIREKFYLNPTQQDLLLSELKNHPAIVEAFVLSTCNRIEIYLHAINPDFSLEECLSLIAKIKKIENHENLRKYIYTYRAQNALEHLLRVTTGLDSLVVGEKQILGQVKNAFERSRGHGMLSKHFNILSNVTLRTGKKAQSETDICLGGSSVSWAAIKIAEKMLGTLQQKSVLVIGAGEMSKLTVEQLANKGFKNLFLMNRTHEHAQELAQNFSGIPVPFCDIKEILAQVQLCICVVDAPHYILDFETMRKIKPAQGDQKILLIDISMPRNIDPKICELEHVNLLYIDDLEQAIEENMKKRMNAVRDVENIIKDKLTTFYDKLNKITEINSANIPESIEA